MKTHRLFIAASLLAAAVQQAHACGDSPHSLGALSFDGTALQLDVSIVSFANFHTCDPMHQVGNQHLESGHVTLFAGDGQTFEQIYVYDLPLFPMTSPTHRVTQQVAYQPGIYAAHADGFVTFSFDAFDTHLDIHTFEFVTVTSHLFADMYFYNAAATVAAVPEPQAYALMIAGLGLLGLRARKAVQS